MFASAELCDLLYLLGWWDMCCSSLSSWLSVLFGLFSPSGNMLSAIVSGGFGQVLINFDFRGFSWFFGAEIFSKGKSLIIIVVYLAR